MRPGPCLRLADPASHEVHLQPYRVRVFKSEPKLCLPGDLTDRLGRTTLSFDAQALQGRCIAILHVRRADVVICSNWDCDGAVPRFRCNGPATEKLLGTVPQRYRWFLVSA
jgi:hypothetical protein